MKPHKKSLTLAIARDIKAGLTHEEVLQKYAVSRGLIRKQLEELVREKLISENEFDKFLNAERKAVDTPSAAGQATKPPVSRVEPRSGNGEPTFDVNMLADIAHDIKSGMTYARLITKYPAFRHNAKILLTQILNDNLITLTELYKFRQTIRDDTDSGSAVDKDKKVEHPKTEKREVAGPQQGTENLALAEANSGLNGERNVNVGRLRWVILLMPIAVGLLSYQYWGYPAFFYGVLIGLGIVIAAMWLLVKSANFSPDGAAMVIGTVSLIAIFYVCFNYTGDKYGNRTESLGIVTADLDSDVGGPLATVFRGIKKMFKNDPPQCERLKAFINDYRKLVKHKGDEKRMRLEIDSLMDKHKQFINEIPPGTAVAYLYPAQLALSANDETSFKERYKELLEWCRRGR